MQLDSLNLSVVLEVVKELMLILKLLLVVEPVEPVDQHLALSLFPLIARHQALPRVSIATSSIHGDQKVWAETSWSSSRIQTTKEIHGPSDSISMSPTANTTSSSRELASTMKSPPGSSVETSMPTSVTKTFNSLI